MGQIEIMEFLDNHRGIRYSTKDLVEIFKESMSRYSVYRALKQIIKREEYNAVVKNILTSVHHKRGRQVVLYWRK